jgi:hypothetical protein
MAGELGRAERDSKNLCDLPVARELLGVDS